jgi:AsmA protein
MERRPLSASLDWRSGRTPFDQAVLQLNVANGAATVAESGLSGPSVRGTVQGRLALPERTLAVRALFETLPTPAGQPGAALAFDLAGPWSDVSIMPDARAVIERSGAARSLLPDLRVQTGEPSRVRESAAQ